MLVRVRRQRRCTRGDAHALATENGEPMQDLLWILVIIGLLAMTIAYVRLCRLA